MPDQESGWARTDEMRLELANSHRRVAERDGIKHGDCDRCQMALDVTQLVKRVRQVELASQRLTEALQTLREEADANVLAGSCPEDKQYAYGIRRAISLVESTLGAGAPEDARQIDTVDKP